MLCWKYLLKNLLEKILVNSANNDVIKQEKEIGFSELAIHNINSEILSGLKAEEKALKSFEQRENPRWLMAGEKSSLNLLIECQNFTNLTTEAIIEKSYQFNLKSFVEKRKKDYFQGLSNEEKEDLFGQWEGKFKENNQYILCRKILGKGYLKEALLISVPAEKSWHIPASLKYGGWNECPEPDVHCALWRHWEENYGAYIVGVSGDTIEAKVLKPPKTREEAKELALVHYFYCNDIVDQGTGTIAALAETLLDSQYWYFWWD